MGTVNRRLGLLLSLAPIGAASLIYVVIVRGFIEGDTGHSLAWPLLGILPMFVFGMWLLTVTSSRSGVFIAAAATAGAVGSAYETFVQRNPELIYEPWFALFNTIGLTADAVTTAGIVSLFATFPTGVPERRWQRIAVWLIWTPVLVGPLALLTTPYVLMPAYIGISAAGAVNPFAVPWLEWAAPLAYNLAYQPWLAAAVGLALLYYRAIFGGTEVRARTRVMAAVVAATVLFYSLWMLFPDIWMLNIGLLASLTAIPLAGIHGILRYGAFDIAPGIVDDVWRARRLFSSRSSTASGSRHRPCCSGTRSRSSARCCSPRSSPSASFRCADGWSGGSAGSSSVTANASSRCSANSAPGSNSP